MTKMVSITAQTATRHMFHCPLSSFARTPPPPSRAFSFAHTRTLLITGYSVLCSFTFQVHCTTHCCSIRLDTPHRLTSILRFHQPGPGIYHVDKLVEHRCINGKDEYLVKWLNCGPEENTWEPTENITADLLHTSVLSLLLRPYSIRVFNFLWSIACITTAS